MTYTPGLAGTAAGNGATVDLDLFDQATGQPMHGSSGTVCNPCGPFTVDATHRRLSIRIDDLIRHNGGGFDKTVKLGFGFIAVQGNDPNGMNLQGFVVNSHSSPFDLSVFGFEPQPLTAAAP